MTAPLCPLAISKCTSYSLDSISKSVSEVLLPFGGLEAFVKPGQKVFLKPNMLSCKDPSAAATTHPIILEAVANECRRIGAQVYIGDSPPMALGRIESYWNTTGFKKVAEKTGATLLALEKEPSRQIRVNGPAGPVSIHVTEWLYSADVVINLPKLKTHNLTVITGAVKNHFGLLPGLQKAQFHKRFPKLSDFGALMADICAATPIPLTIFDGVEGMDGQGPGGGRVIKTGLIMAAVDPVAIDLAFSAIAGLDPEKIPTLARCRKIDLGPKNLTQVRIFGEPISSFKYPGFQAPAEPIFAKIPGVMVKIAQRLIWMRPKLKKGLCIKCKACERICPATAISIAEEGPHFNRKSCISCFCCMEVCPVDSIEMQTSSLIKLALLAREVKRFFWGEGKTNTSSDVERRSASIEETLTSVMK